MKKRPRSRKQAARPLQNLYAATLRSHLSGAGEASLRQAYEIGRSALGAGFGVLDMAEMHLTVQANALRHSSVPQNVRRTLEAAGEICLESLSSYEMAHRGFREANAALRHLNQLLEQEANRIARELHDEAGQLLAAVYLALDEAAQDLTANQTERLARVKEILRQVEGHLRRMSHELRPLVLDDLGLAPAIRFLAEGVSKRTGLVINVEALAEERFPAQVELALYRVVQEALNNAAKHGRARNVSIEIERQENVVGCTIRDDGRGFRADSMAARGNGKGLGLIGMRERVGSLGGTLEVKSRPGKGTQVRARLPVWS